jgi:hypothetical protein
LTDAITSVEYAGVHVCWRPELDGGGRTFGQDFLPLVRALIGPVSRLMEFCAGPGFIGFSLLAHGLCESLVLADVNPAAVTVAQETVRRNRLEDRVRIYLSDGLAGVSDQERVDLVVANPPHFARSPTGVPSLLSDDPGWQLHRVFYREIGRFLAPGASVLMQENSEGSRPEDFWPMIEDARLDLLNTFWYTGGQAGPNFYYLWLMNRIPGLVTYRGAPAVQIPLSGAQPASVIIDKAGPYTLRVVNEMDHVARVQLVDDAQRDQLWAPLAGVAVGGHLDLPPLALRPGQYALVEPTTKKVLARLSVAAGHSERD